MESALLEPTMAKKKKPERPDGPYFLLRLPTEYWDLLQAICDVDKRNMTTEAQIAFEARAKKLNLKFRANYPENM